MTKSRIVRKLSGSPYFFAFGALLAACSGSEAEPAASGGAGGSVIPNAGAAGTANASGNGNGAGGNAAGGNAAGGNASGELVGSFQVQLVVDDEDASMGSTSVIGKVSDGKSPAPVIWTEIKADGDCRLETPSVPFCDPACGADVCVADDTCKPHPTGHSVGEVTLDGLNLAAGGSTLMLREIVKAYQPPANTTFAWPPFAEGDEIKIKAAGGDYTAFELTAQGVKPLILTSTTFEVAEATALNITWEAASDPKASQVHLKLDISHHGGTRGMIQCDTDDTGSLTVSADLMTELIGLGVAGFPTFVLTRSTRGTAQIAPGVVELEVSAKVEQAVTVAGVVSCTDSADCPDGGPCRDDLTCE
jgi:hypothetical protein